MFSRKVLRKLEGNYDDSTKKGLEELWGRIEESKAESKAEKNYELPITISLIEKMIEKI
jgi:hypothetical protein